MTFGVVLFEGSGGSDSPHVSSGTEADHRVTEPGSSTVLDLSAGGLDMSAAPCPEVDSALIARAPIAFKGTVTGHGQGIVDLVVERAYAGVRAEAATVTASRGVDYWLGPVAWDVGSQYLVTAYSGVVRFCGQTGKATAELQAVFDEAFPD